MLDVVAHANLRLRGQAFVVFDSIDSAESAISALNSTKVDGLKGSVVQVTYAKSPSDATVAKRGDKELDSHVRSRVAQKELKQLSESSSNKRRAEPVRPAAETPAKKAKTTSETTYNPVHKILLLQNLPKSASQDSVAALFSDLPGYVEVRLVPARQVGFAEFETEAQAVLAKEKSQGAEIEGEKLLVSYAKK